ncbi:SDR family oxidoreductase [Pseudochryseolinea flava]|uniref:Short-chain dehydrogenase n=1 Tax=Pseudochryseolinea flava TaxID=2059302 RepID=A0A364XWP1_9BACT|nr:SDR family oxidoreductase [Pseudochryseolinea flava]RAV98591.1 short-chain dehydrogenase [Pseudochryseolinea flava]
MNKLIVVTGGTKGIGRAIIEKFAREGFDVVTCARKEVDLRQLVAHVENTYDVRCHAHVADMSEPEQVKLFCEKVLLLRQPINVLVNNAGFFIPGEIATEPAGTLEKMIEGNLYSAYYTTRGLVHVMKDLRQGHIFNICSIASIQAYANGGSYAISKFALLGFSKCLREELKQHQVKVTAVLPGATRTASWDGTTLPDERFMPSEDIAETIYSTYSLSDRTVIEEILIRPQLGDI